MSLADANSLEFVDPTAPVTAPVTSPVTAGAVYDEEDEA